MGDTHTIHTAEERYHGYVEAHAAHGVPLDPTLQARDVHGGDAATEAAGRILDLADPPTALFTAQNMLTVGAVRALRARGLQHEVALVGFDDFLLSDLLDPPVTVVAQDPDEIGRIAAERLMARIEGDMSAAAGARGADHPAAARLRRAAPGRGLSCPGAPDRCTLGA